MNPKISRNVSIYTFRIIRTHPKMTKSCKFYFKIFHLELKTELVILPKICVQIWTRAIFGNNTALLEFEKNNRSYHTVLKKL